MAITAEPTCEPAYRLLARACLAAGDGSSARAALARCRAALSDLGVQPDAATAKLEATLAGRSGAD
jgi:DNA-binding SARP family transcriptional activator